MFAVLDGTKTTRIEARQADPRESNKMWFICHLEIIKKYVLDEPSLLKTWWLSVFLLITKFLKPSEQVPPHSEKMDAGVWVRRPRSKWDHEPVVDMGLKHLHKHRDDRKCEIGPEVDIHAPEPLLSLKQSLICSPGTCQLSLFRCYYLAAKCTRKRQERLGKRCWAWNLTKVGTPRKHSLLDVWINSQRCCSDKWKQRFVTQISLCL